MRYEKPGEAQRAEILKSLASQQALKAIIEKLNSESKTLNVTLTRSSPSSKQSELTKDEFDQKAIRKETATEISYDLRPLGGKQRMAVSLYLSELIFRQSIGALKSSRKHISLLVDNSLESSSQIDGFIEKLKSSGVQVSINKNGASA